MMHGVQKRYFDKEGAKEKREAEDRARTEWKDKKDNDQINFEKMFLMAIGGETNNQKREAQGKA